MDHLHQAPVATDMTTFVKLVIFRTCNMQIMYTG